MARYDPRYDYNPWYGVGNAALGLADILGQGFDRYHRIGQDEQAQQNSQRDYLLRLQQMLGLQETQRRDRAAQDEALGVSREARAAKQSGLFKALTLGPDVTTETAAPVERLPQDASDREPPPSVMRVLGRRPRTLEDAAQTFTPQEAGDADVIDLLLKKFGSKTPKAAEPFTLGEGQTRYDPTGQPVASMPKAPKAAESFTLSEGQTRYGPTGDVLAQVPKEAKPPESFTLSEGQIRYGPTGAVLAQVPKEATPKDFTLSEGQIRYTPTGEVVAQVPTTPQDFTLGEGQTRYAGTQYTPIASVPKAPKEVKPWAEGKTATELEIYIADPSTSPEQRTIAQQALTQIREADLKKARETGAIAAGTAAKSAEARIPAQVYERRLKDVDELNQVAEQAATVIDQLEELSKKISIPDATARATGYLTREFGAKSQSDPTLTMFGTQVGKLAPLVRAMGQKGSFSDRDIENALTLIPGMHDVDAVKAEKIVALREFFQRAQAAAERRLQTPAGTPPLPILKDLVPKAPGPTGARLRVRRKSDGQTGSILEEDFDPNTYERLR